MTTLTSNTGWKGEAPDLPFPRIALTVGEPAGIGPDIVLKLATNNFEAALVAFADPQILKQRDEALGLGIQILDLSTGDIPRHRPGTLLVRPSTCPEPVIPGKTDTRHQGYVLQTIRDATTACLEGEYDAMVTGPVNKAVINRAGVPFSGHTEYIAEQCNSPQPVMVLENRKLRVALATTHLPLSAVSRYITAKRLEDIIRVINRELVERFAVSRPQILVCGLNPHAGEEGELGSEEISIISPVLEKLRAEGLSLRGPVPADTAFVPEMLANTDLVLTMYHDQGLPVLKSQGFGDTVNITFGLPVIRTSVDHGTALDLAATGKASADSLAMALDTAIRLAGRKRAV